LRGLAYASRSPLGVHEPDPDGADRDCQDQGAPWTAKIGPERGSGERGKERDPHSTPR